MVDNTYMIGSDNSPSRTTSFIPSICCMICLFFFPSACPSLHIYPACLYVSTQNVIISFLSFFKPKNHEVSIGDGLATLMVNEPSRFYACIDWRNFFQNNNQKRRKSKNWLHPIVTKTQDSDEMGGCAKLVCVTIMYTRIYTYSVPAPEPITGSYCTRSCLSIFA
jgi:hypothetical protein